MVCLKKVGGHKGLAICGEGAVGKKMFDAELDNFETNIDSGPMPPRKAISSTVRKLARHLGHASSFDG